MSAVRTNIVLEETLVRKAMKVLGAKSKREAVHLALKEVVDRRVLYADILATQGKLTWTGKLRREARAA